MRYLVVVPSIRQALPGFDGVVSAIKASLTQPTEFHVLDGSAGKSQTLNEAYDEWLLPWDGDVYVTLDDDLIPPYGWQDAICAGFEALPEVGMLSIWLGDQPMELNYMGAGLVGPEQVTGSVRYRIVEGNHHIPGYLLAFRRAVAVKVGKLPNSELKYQIWEDAWRGRRVRKQGIKLAYIVTEQPPTLHVYADDPAYVASKEVELRSGRLVEDQMLDAGGVGDGFVLKLRKRIARWRGRG